MKGKKKAAMESNIEIWQSFGSRVDTRSAQGSRTRMRMLKDKGFKKFTGPVVTPVNHDLTGSRNQNTERNFARNRGIGENLSISSGAKGQNRASTTFQISSSSKQLRTRDFVNPGYNTTVNGPLIGKKLASAAFYKSSG